MNANDITEAIASLQHVILSKSPQVKSSVIAMLQHARNLQRSLNPEMESLLPSGRGVVQLQNGIPALLAPLFLPSH